MTKEELKNKYTEREKIFQQAMESCKSSNPMDCIEWFADRIAELEKQLAISEHDREHNDYELTEVYKKIAELEAQIEKMKCCQNCDNWNWKHNKCEKKLKGDCFKASKWQLRR